jgi:hypothetical protein
MTDHASPVLEVDERDYNRSWWRRGKLLTKWGSLIGGIVYAVFIIAWSATRGYDYRTVVLFLVAEAIVFAVVYYESWELAQLNRFGIFEQGISPPRKPKSYRRAGERVVVPYESIAQIEYKKVGSGIFPNSHFGAVLHLKDGEEFEFDATEIFAQTRWKEEQVARAQVVLEELVRQLDNWRSDAKAGAFRFRPGKMQK